MARETFMDDIETLNEKSQSALYDITAISIAQYPNVVETYDLTACGASLGNGYGPKVVAKEPLTVEELLTKEGEFAVPGERTSALAALRILAGEQDISWQSLPFTEIMDEVSTGNFIGGVVIHEGQLTFEKHSLHEICDLGAWWKSKTSLPLPLGGNSIKRDLDERFGVGATKEVTHLLLQSIKYAMKHRKKSLEWAMQWGRGIDIDCTDEFVEMYVNKWTLDFGDCGRAAVRRFLDEAAKVRALPDVREINFV